MAKPVILPVVLAATPAFAQDVTHHLYISRTDTTATDENAPRSLTVSNLPVFTTDAHLRHLFSVQLSGGLVERARFQTESSTTGPSLQVEEARRSGKKRKRVTVEELEQSLGQHGLPDVWENSIHVGSAIAVVTFVDQTSMEASFKAAKKAAKSQKKIIWGKGIEDKISPLGERLYKNHNKLQFPSRQELLSHTEDYLTIFAEIEEAKARENAKKRQIPDEDGFVTVMKGSKGFVREEDGDALAEKAKEKNKTLDNFYRFQVREKQKGEQSDLLRKFEEDKRKVQEIKMRRGKLVPE